MTRQTQVLWAAIALLLVLGGAVLAMKFSGVFAGHPANERRVDYVLADKKPGSAKPAVETLADAGPSSEKAADRKPADAQARNERPAEGKPAGSKPAKEAGPFAVPDGGPKEMVAFVKKVFPLFVRIREPEVQADARASIMTALDRVLAGKPNDQDMEFAVQAKAVMLGDPQKMADFEATLKKSGRDKYVRMVESLRLAMAIKTATSVEQAKAAATAGLKFLAERPLEHVDSQLGRIIAQLSWNLGDDPWAASTFRSLAKMFAASKNPQFAEFNAILAGTVRRLDLLGKPMTVEGKLLGGATFDWSMYAGKVVLVEFWATKASSSVRELPNLRDYYDRYHDKGFEIVGVCLDRTAADVEAFVKERRLPWPILVGDNKTPNPTVAYYAVMAIPTAILVGRDGKVVSLTARGEKLGEELAKLLDPPKAKKEGPAAKTAGGGSKGEPDKAKK
jgi:peroxiredoxin